MFGYLRMLKQNATHQHHKAYKNYYCGMCFAMQYNYGNLSRFLISYDLVIIGLLTKSHDQPLIEKMKCFGQFDKKQQFVNENWKKVAAVNLLLTTGQLRDNIEDENSILAKIVYRIYFKAIKKAESEYPELSDFIVTGYKKLLVDEKANKNVKELSMDFSVLMKNIYRHIQANDEVIEENVEYIKAVAGWLYFIDQLDDYDKDVKKKRFNPLVKHGLSRVEYFDRHFVEMHELLQHYYKAINEATKKVCDSCVESELLIKIALNSIPLMTGNILNRRKVQKPTKFRFRTNRSYV